MTQKPLAFLLGLVVSSLLFELNLDLVAGEPRTGKARPNIVLLMADDMGWGDPGYNDVALDRKTKWYRRPNPDGSLTPHLDAMAKNGLRFNRFYAAAPVCSPTRGSCLTGRHPFRYGITFANVGHLPDGERTLAEVCRDNGYRTGHFGKWHLGTLTTQVKDSNRGGTGNKQHFAPPNRHGFDVYFSTEAKVPTFDPLIRPMESKRTWWLPATADDKVEFYGTRYFENGRPFSTGLRGDDSGLIMEAALKFIQQKSDQPFFAVIWFHAPHLPVVAGEGDRRPFAHLPPYHQSYFGCIRAMDRQIGQLRDTLRQRDLANDTVLCFCSDNGPEGKKSAPGSTGGLRGRKRSLYEGGIRVPGIIEWPGKIRPAVTDFPAVTSDYFPTFCEIIEQKFEPRRKTDGVSLKQVFQSPDSATRNSPIYFESGNRAAVVDNRFKLVCQISKKDDKITASELFDLHHDPAESDDVSDENPDLVKMLRENLASWRSSCRKSLASHRD